MNAVIYARYSSSKQREESIEAQLKVCHKYAEEKGYIVVGEYADRAISGRSDDRPQFQKMIHDSKKRHFEKVIVYRLDRFSRDSFAPILYMAELEKSNDEKGGRRKIKPDGFSPGMHGGDHPQYDF